MAAEIPASINIPSVAFEIPIEKKEISCPPTVQIRLAGQLDSPRKETSLDDINKKLSDANKRKQESLDFDVSKVATHNAKVYSIFEKAKEQENEKARSLEERITSKLSDAESRKDSMKTSWIERLSQTTIDKLQRGSKVKADEEWSAKELGAKIDIKSLQADLRREELKLKTREELAAANHEKLGKSQIAANAAEVEAKKIVACTEQKISAAEHRRDKNQILVSARISESAALKKEKVDDMLKREKEQRRKLNAEIQEKVRRAAERKEQTIAEKIEALSAQTSDKLRRAAAVGKLEEEKAKEKSEQIRTKVELANQRRDDIIREQQEILKELAGKKERLVIERQKEEEKAIKVIGKMIRSKMHSANQRKEIMRASKVESIKSDQETKQARAKDVMQMSLNEAKELRRLSDKRMNKATKKKNALLKAMVDEKMDANKSKASTHIICKRIHIEKVEYANKIKELEEIQRLIDIEKRIAEANANRESHLLGKMPTKRMATRSSPRVSSPTSSELDEIAERINQANLRRELFLAEKVENATRNRKPKGEDGVPEFETEVVDEDQILRGLNLYLVAIGGIAAVIVGLISYWKHSK